MVTMDGLPFSSHEQCVVNRALAYIVSTKGHPIWTAGHSLALEGKEILSNTTINLT
jgi:hypothetical protein